MTTTTGPTPAPADLTTDPTPTVELPPTPLPAPDEIPDQADDEPSTGSGAEPNDGLLAKLGNRAEAAAATLGNWWGFVRQPMSLREAWRLSGSLDARRIPGESPILTALWWVSNRTDRPLLFLCLAWLPLWAAGPVLWCATRPTRRWALYTVVFLLYVVVPSIMKG